MQTYLNTGPGQRFFTLKNCRFAYFQVFNPYLYKTCKPRKVKGLTDITETETKIIWNPCDTVNDLLPVKNNHSYDYIIKMLF